MKLRQKFCGSEVVGLGSELHMLSLLLNSAQVTQPVCDLQSQRLQGHTLSFVCLFVAVNTTTNLLPVSFLISFCPRGQISAQLSRSGVSAANALKLHAPPHPWGGQGGTTAFTGHALRPVTDCR